MSGPAARLGFRPRMAPGPMPDDVQTFLVTVKTHDGSTAQGVLHSLEGATTVVALMHPRQDLSRHHLVPDLLRAGHAVWTQGSRTVNNDLTLVHEETLLDAAAGFVHLRDRGYEHMVAVGPSGGATLYAFYAQQSGRASADRIAVTPGGRPIDLAGATMPVLDGIVFLAPHPGQGELLLGCIDGSVADEGDPLATVADLDMFDERNGFRAAPESSSYDGDFLARYGAAQRARVARIDARARWLIEARQDAKARAKTTGSTADLRAGTMTQILTVYRTDADPRTVDLSLDPSERPYGSIHGHRPDVINFGVTGFGRLTTPDAWLSTWSGLSSNARFVTCGPEVEVPSLFIEYTADQATFPTVAQAMVDSLGGADTEHQRIVGTHFGGSPSLDGPPGGTLAATSVIEWLGARFPRA